MPSQNFIPPAEAELILWLKTINDKIDGYAVALALDPAKLAEIHSNIDSLLTAIENSISAKEAWLGFEAAKKGVKKTNVSYLRKTIERFKTESGYTEEIGRNLNVISAKIVLDPETYKPGLKAKAYPDYVKLDFTKKGVDGVRINKRLKGESAWKFLVYATKSPYLDISPLQNPSVPEVWEYMCIGVINDVKFGQESDVVIVVYDGAS